MLAKYSKPTAFCASIPCAPFGAGDFITVWHLLFLFSFVFETESLCHQATVQWCDLRSLQRPPTAFKQLSYLVSRVAGTEGSHHYHTHFFVVFSRNGVSPCWPGWSQSLALMICPPQPPNVIGLYAWATAPSLPSGFVMSSSEYKTFANRTQHDVILMVFLFLLLQEKPAAWCHRRTYSFSFKQLPRHSWHANQFTHLK